MKMSDIKEYIEHRKKLENKIIDGLLQLISDEVKDLPEDSIAEIGESVASAGSEIAETIAVLLAEED